MCTGGEGAPGLSLFGFCQKQAMVDGTVWTCHVKTTVYSRKQSTAPGLFLLLQLYCYKCASGFPDHISNISTLETLSFQQLWPWMEKRKEVPHLPKATMDALNVCGFSRNRGTQAEELPQKCRQCRICPTTQRTTQHLNTILIFP